MSKKAKILVSMLLVLILTLAVPTAMVMAQEDESTTAPLAGQFFARVAEILGFDQEELENAFEQAREEMREEAPGWCTGNVTASRIKERLVNRQQVRQMLREEITNRCTANATSQERLECIQEQLQNRQQLQDEILDRPAPRARLFKAMRGRHMMAVPDGWSGGV